MNTERVKQLEAVIRQMLTPLKSIPFDLVIESICGQKVLDFDNSIRSELIEIVDLSGAKINENGIITTRRNEVGNKCEPFVIAAINELGYEADIPRSKSGKKRAVGYPDIFAKIKAKLVYIEIKTYNPKLKSSSMRAFYLSPSLDFKVTQDAFHLIFAFETCEEKSGVCGVAGCKVLDAKNLLCDVKYEFNAANQDMYMNENLLIFERSF